MPPVPAPLRFLAVAVLLAVGTQAAHAGPSSASRSSSFSGAKSGSSSSLRSSAAKAALAPRTATSRALPASGRTDRAPNAVAGMRAPLPAALQERASRRAAALAARAPQASGTGSMSLWTMLALAVLLSENGQRESETQALQQEIAHLRAGLPAEEQALAAAVAAREGIALPDAAVPASPGSLLPAAPEAPTAQSARSSETAALEEKLGDLSRFVMPVFLLLFVLTGLRMVLRG